MRFISAIRWRLTRPFGPSRLGGRGVAWALLAGLPLASLSGCGEIAFYYQASRGQLEVKHKSLPIPEVLADPAVSPKVKRGLRLVLEAQDFAQKELSYPEGIGYTTYSDIGRMYVTHVVIGSKPLSLEPQEDCYPFLGCLSYRGYFHLEDAQRYQAKLAKRGLDTLVRPVPAYSTLGWFNDPVLPGMLAMSDEQLVALVLHEQAHRILFVPGDTPFNESFATFVERQGVRQWLALNRPNRQPFWRDYLAEQDRFAALMDGGRLELEAVYAGPEPDQEKLRRKAAVFQALRQRYQSARGSFKILMLDEWFGPAMNNAHFIAMGQYQTWEDSFEALFAQEEGDWSRFFAQAGKLADLEPEAREAQLKALLAPPHKMEETR